MSTEIRLPRYPAGLITGVLPRSSNRRRRGGFSLSRFVYFGSHPLLVLAGWYWCLIWGNVRDLIPGAKARRARRKGWGG